MRPIPASLVIILLYFAITVALDTYMVGAVVKIACIKFIDFSCRKLVHNTQYHMIIFQTLFKNQKEGPVYVPMPSEPGEFGVFLSGTASCVLILFYRVFSPLVSV